MGFQRLNIIERSHLSDQPYGKEFYSKLLFNGEIYNFRELANLNFRESIISDTELFYKLLMNSQQLSMIRGMFAFCHIDSSKDLIKIGRDFYGKKPLFYWSDNNFFIAASEIPPIHKIIKKLIPNDEQIIKFAEHGFIPYSSKGYSYFSKIKSIRPNSINIFDINKKCFIEKKKIFELRQSKFLFNCKKLNNDIEEAVLLRSSNEVKTGLFLSGGIDSALILKIIYEKNIKNIEIFIGDTGNPLDNDYIQARRLMDNLKLNYHIVKFNYYNKYFFDFYDEIVKHQYQPSPFVGNNFGLNVMYKFAKSQGCKVIIDGTGSDEIFSGYTNSFFAPQILKNLLQKLNFIDFFQLTKILKKKHTNKQLYEFLFKNKKDNLIKEKLRFLRNGLTSWITQNDLNAMMYSIENRSPFLDINLSKYIFLEFEKNFKSGFNKKVLRDILSKNKNFKEIASNKEKKGFSIDVSFGLRNYSKQIKVSIQKSFYCKKLDLQNYKNLNHYAVSRFDKFFL